MKNLLLIGFSVVTMLVSCKCKKATTEIIPAETVAMEVKPGESMPDKLIPVDNTGNAVTKSDAVTQEHDVVEYEANSRGFFLKIRYSNGQLYYSKDRDSNKMQPLQQLTKNQVDELNALLSSVDAAKLPELKAPTEKRFYDGAAIGGLKIIKGGKEFNSQAFDHGAPPAPIEKFVEKLLSYTEEK